MNQEPASTPAPAQSIPSPLNVNYQAFDRVKAGPYSWFWATLLWSGIILGGASVLFFAAAHIEGNGSLYKYGGISLVAGVLLVGATIPFGSKQITSLEKSLKQFMADNHWTTLTNRADNDIPTSIFDESYSYQTQDMFGGVYRGLPFRALLYESSANGVFMSCAIFHFDLTKSYPLIVLDNCADIPKYERGSPAIKNGRLLQLEGDFNNQYRVSVLPGTEQQALEVVTPDLMAGLMGDSMKASAELEASRLYIIDDSGKWDAATLKEMFAAADVMIKNLGELSASWQASSTPAAAASIAPTALSVRQAPAVPKTSVLSKIRFGILVTLLIMILSVVLLFVAVKVAVLLQH